VFIFPPKGTFSFQRALLDPSLGQYYRQGGRDPLQHIPRQTAPTPGPFPALLNPGRAELVCASHQQTAFQRGLQTADCEPPAGQRGLGRHPSWRQTTTNRRARPHEGQPTYLTQARATNSMRAVQTIPPPLTGGADPPKPEPGQARPTKRPASHTLLAG